MDAEDLYDALDRLSELEKKLKEGKKPDFGSPDAIEYNSVRDKLPDLFHVNEIVEYHAYVKERLEEKASDEKEELDEALKSLKDENTDLKNPNYQNENVKNAIKALKETLEIRYKNARDELLSVLREKCSPAAYSTIAVEVEDILAVAAKEEESTASQSPTTSTS